MQKQIELRKKTIKLLEQFFSEKKKTSLSPDIYYQELVEQISSLTLRGGDKMRPQLVYFAYLAIKKNLSRQEERNLLNFSLCVELFHTACLIHDDLMDNSLIRRGGLTVHEHFAKKYQNPKLGKKLAILAGDLALIWAEEIFSQYIERISCNRNTVNHYFNLLREEVIKGQQLDLLITEQFSWQDVSADLILEMYKYKTAKYSFERPIHLGLALAQAGKKNIETFSKYALSVGVAFQIKDDLLGSFGKSQKTGKSTQDDIRDKKRTLLLALTKEKMGDKLIDAKITEIKRLMISSGAFDRCEEQASALVDQGKKALFGVKINKQAQDFFLHLADYAVSREE